MKKSLLLLPVLLMSCSHIGSRRPAALGEDNYQFKFQLSSNPIFANGANSTVLGVRLLDQSGNEVPIKASDLELVTDSDSILGKFTETNGMKTITISPSVRSPKVRFMVVWKGSVVSDIQELKTTQAPLKDKLEPIKVFGSGTMHVNGHNHSRNENFTPGLFEGISINNWGTNSIVNPKAYPDSNRSFDFDFNEQATQNISFTVSDAPNSTTSHGMMSHFILFPRKILPTIEKIGNDQSRLTLTNGETIDFSKEGYITGGVFTEGAVDTSGDRFTRKYANLKYQGKGILLRANARGQMPQQGQFENTKIDMEYGLKGSAEVLIINGETGQRCRRPKIDFWTTADISPIPFKFPTDKEFDSYLRSKCGFGIPDMEIPKVSEGESVEGLAQDIWGRCEKNPKGEVNPNSELIVLKNEYIDPSLKGCLDSELGEVKKVQRSKVAFDLFFIMREARAQEKEGLSEFVDRAIPAKRSELLENLSWLSDVSLKNVEAECLKKSPSKSENLRFFKASEVLHKPISQMCSTLKDGILPVIESDVSQLTKSILSDLSWIKNIQTMQNDCLEKLPTLINTSMQYRGTPKVYESSYSKICKEVESSSSYQEWLRENLGVLEEKVFNDSLVELEKLAEEKANRCLVDYPMNNTLNRIRYKKGRENCFVEDWELLENAAIQKSLIKPVSTQKIKELLAPQTRRIQLKVLKDKLT